MRGLTFQIKYECDGTKCNNGRLNAGKLHFVDDFPEEGRVVSSRVVRAQLGVCADEYRVHESIFSSILFEGGL